MKPTTHWVLTLIGAIGIPALFLPFVFDATPAKAIFDQQVWQLALPGFLSPLIVGGSVRWIVFGTLSRLERAVAYILGAGAVAAMLSGYFFKFTRPSGAQEWLTWILPPVVLCLGAYLLRAAPSKEFKPVMAMQMAYLANAVLCLVGFWGDWQIGAYCVLVASSMFVLQIVLILTQRVRDRGRATRTPNS
jgi:hypothetical protein